MYCKTKLTLESQIWQAAPPVAHPTGSTCIWNTVERVTDLGGFLRAASVIVGISHLFAHTQAHNWRR